MTTLLDMAIRAAITAFLLLLAGCGPGTGGTGTGPSAIAGIFTGQGSVAGSSSCRVNCDGLVLKLDEVQVELQAPCVRFVHESGLPAGTAGDILLPGRIETTSAGGTTAAPGSLRLQFEGGNLAEATQVTVSLHGEAGATMLGPVVLLRGNPAPAAPPVCAAP